MVSTPHLDAGGRPTASNSVPISLVSLISANSIPSLWMSFHLTVWPLSATVNKQQAFQRKLLTIALYRSAISQAHDPVGSTQLGSLPVVAPFMKEVF